MHLVGAGSFADRRLVIDGKVSLPAKVVTVARHLGSHLGEKASFPHELPRRRQATMTALFSVGQLWCESRVSWRLKRCFLISRVVNTALSGIEAFRPSKAKCQLLTSLVTCLARRVMAGAAARRGERGRVRTLTNKEVLRFWKLAPCDVEARVRRLKWAQTLVQDPSHHAQLITGMSGKLPSEPDPTLGSGGEILPEANPWAVRWMAGLEELEPLACGGFGLSFWIVIWQKILFQLMLRCCDYGRWLSRSHPFGSSNGIVGGRSATVEVLL